VRNLFICDCCHTLETEEITNDVAKGTAHYIKQRDSDQQREEQAERQGQHTLPGKGEDHRQFDHCQECVEQLIGQRAPHKIDEARYSTPCQQLSTSKQLTAT